MFSLVSIARCVRVRERERGVDSLEPSCVQVLELLSSAVVAVVAAADSVAMTKARDRARGCAAQAVCTCARLPLALRSVCRLVARSLGQWMCVLPPPGLRRVCACVLVSSRARAAVAVVDSERRGGTLLLLLALTLAQEEEGRGRARMWRARGRLVRGAAACLRAATATSRPCRGVCVRAAAEVGIAGRPARTHTLDARTSERASGEASFDRASYATSYHEESIAEVSQSVQSCC